jgi:GntR family transcriptional regulator
MVIDKGSDGQARPASPIEFQLDPGSGLPTYVQLIRQVEHALRLGYLKPGDRLPTVKETVTALAINPNTVLKAYRDLETRGLAVGRPGQGTFVDGTLGEVALPQLAALRRTLLAWLGTAAEAGLNEDAVDALFSSVLLDFSRQRGGGFDEARAHQASRDRRISRGDKAEGVA